MAISKKNTIIGGAIGQLAGPVGAVVGAYIGSKVRKGAHTADDFVSKYQNVFSTDIASIIDPLTQARTAGTLTLEQVQQAKEKYDARLQQFKDDAFTYSLKGGTERKVVGQALGEFGDMPGKGNLDPIIAEWNKTFETDLANLTPPGENTPEPPPTMESVTPGMTPEGAAGLAANQARKRAIAGGGRRSTILGGTVKQPGLSLQKPSLLGINRYQKRPTILGYGV